MSEAFFRNFSYFAKQAGTLDNVLRSAFTAPGGTQSVRSGVAQTLGGLAGAAAVSEGEHAIIDRLGLASPDANTSTASRLFTHGLNAVLLGLPFGNPRNRLDTFATRSPQTGLPNPGMWDTSKATRSTFMKLIGVPAGAAGINLAAATNDIKDMTGTASQAVTDLSSKANSTMDDMQHSVAQVAPTVDAMRDIVAGPDDVKSPEDAVKAFSQGRPIGLRDYANMAAHKGGDMAGKFDEAMGEIKKLQPNLEAVGELARWIPNNAAKALKYTGGTVLAAGGLYGAYNLFRDWLNYRRVQQEREARQQRSSAPKLASALDRFHAVNTPDQVAARHAAVNSQQAAHYNNVASGAAAAVAERKAMQQIQTQSSPYTAAGNGTLKQDVVTGADGSQTIYDKSGRPVGTNSKAIARPQGAIGGKGPSPVQSRNPQLGAQIAAQAPGAPTTPPPIATPKPAPAVAAAPPKAPPTTPRPTPPATPAAAATPPPAAPPIKPPTSAVAAAPTAAPAAPATPAAAAAAAPPQIASNIGMPGSPNPFDGVVKPAPYPTIDPFAQPATPAPTAAAAKPAAPAPGLTGQIPLVEPGGGTAPATSLPTPTVPPGAPKLLPPGPQGRSPFNKEEAANQASNAAGMNTTNSMMSRLPMMDLTRGKPGGSPLDVTANHASSINKIAAAPPWLQFLGKRVAPAAALGAGEGYLNYELDPAHPATAILGGLLGSYGGFKLMSPDKLQRTLAPYLTAGGGLIPRALSALTASAKDNLASADLKSVAAKLTTPAVIGGGLLTAGGLAALWQATRAAKRVGDGEPLVNASSTVFAGGSGGPDNPNVGGKIRVTLPTRNPGDNETQVELPLENMPLSGSVIGNIRRDVKRRLRSEGSVRTIPRESSTSIKSLMNV